MVIDVITYNGEADLLEIRLNILDDYVQEFVICEATKTFSGRDKPLYFERDRERFAKWLGKIRYHVIPDEYTEDEKRLAEESPNTQGADHWKREFLQKESIKKALTHLRAEDLVFIGDCDEIWNPQHMNFYKSASQVEKMKLRVYTYYLNNESDEEFWGTIYGKWGWIKDFCLNHLRTDPPKKLHGKWGWHFTSLKDGLKRKLEDSYTEDSYANEWVMNNLDINIESDRDFLGRDFSYTINEAKWPDFLKKNREKYRHLLKNEVK